MVSSGVYAHAAQAGPETIELDQDFVDHGLFEMWHGSFQTGVQQGRRKLADLVHVALAFGSFEGSQLKPNVRLIIQDSQCIDGVLERDPDLMATADRILAVSGSDSALPRYLTRASVVRRVVWR